MVRVRITRQLSGSIDGIRLDDFAVGLVYDVGTTLGSYLLCEGAAEPVLDESPALVTPINQVRFRVTGFTPRLVSVRPSDRLAVAADREPRRKSAPRRKKKKTGAPGT